MGVASLVLGIISIVGACFAPALTAWIFAIPGIIGIILAAVGKKNNAKCATAGLVLSIIGTALALIAYIACAACVASVGLLVMIMESLPVSGRDSSVQGEICIHIL